MLKNEFPVEMLCGLLACPRSSYYYKQASEDVCVRDAIEQIAAANPIIGQHLVEHIETGTVCRYRVEDSAAGLYCKNRQSRGPSNSG